VANYAQLLVRYGYLQVFRRSFREYRQLSTFGTLLQPDYKYHHFLWRKQIGVVRNFVSLRVLSFGENNPPSQFKHDQYEVLREVYTSRNDQRVDEYLRFTHQLCSTRKRSIAPPFAVRLCSPPTRTLFAASPILGGEASSWFLSAPFSSHHEITLMTVKVHRKRTLEYLYRTGTRTHPKQQNGLNKYDVRRRISHHDG
jgi:hypothetical protein